MKRYISLVIFLLVFLLPSEAVQKDFVEIRVSQEKLVAVIYKYVKPSHCKARYFACLILDISYRYDLDPLLVTSINIIESRFNNLVISKPCKKCIPPIWGGDHGLMQISKGLAREKGIKDLGKLLDPDFNINIGCEYLKELKDKYGSRFVGHYNSGTIIEDESYEKKVYKQYSLLKEEFK